MNLKWSFRRLHLCKLDKSLLVLEVGSGGNPFPRANVLSDAFEITGERGWESLVSDRPTVLAYGENLPFKDKAFDFVICSHVLEHTPYPEKFLKELQRVAHAGYIETPDAFMERINPYKNHRLEVTVRDNVLVIRKKPAWIYDPDLVELYEDRAKAVITRETIPQHPSQFHMRYFWRDEIKFKVINPEVDASWIPQVNSTPSVVGIKSKLRLFILSLIRKLFSQSRRNTKLNILPLMRFPKCHSENLMRVSTSEINCKDCGAQYKINSNIFQII